MSLTPNLPRTRSGIGVVASPRTTGDWALDSPGQGPATPRTPRATDGEAGIVESSEVRQLFKDKVPDRRFLGFVSKRVAALWLACFVLVAILLFQNAEVTTGGSPSTARPVLTPRRQSKDSPSPDEAAAVKHFSAAIASVKDEAANIIAIKRANGELPSQQIGQGEEQPWSPALDSDDYFSQFPEVVKVTLADGSEFTVYDEPVGNECQGAWNIEIDGDPVKLGMENMAHSAAQCCRMCRNFGKLEDGRGCNVWMYCAEPMGTCWLPDDQEHKTGECWLKWQAGWDNNPDHQTSNLAVVRRGELSEEFRAEHPTAPEAVQWMGGLNPQEG